MQYSSLNQDRSNSAHGQFRLAPPDGLSESERSERSRIYTAPAEEEKPVDKRAQFGISTLLALTLFVALGLAGRSSLSPSAYAAVTGLVALLALIWLSRNPPESPFVRFVLGSFSLTYIIASGVAMLVR